MTSLTVDVSVEPTFRLTPREVSNAWSEAVDLAASAGLVLDSWQVAELRNGLGERADGSWAASEVGVIVPRQNGKGEILLARELAGLFLFGERMILHSAHEFRTAQDAYRRLIELIEGAPHLDALVKRKLNNTTETSVELFSGQRVRFVSRTKGAGRGLSGDVVILDEAYKLPAEAMAALIPTMAARPNRQLWYTSSAPLPAIESDTLRRLCLRGRNGEGDRLAYGEYCVPAKSPSDVDIGDRDLWRQANPSMVSRTPHGIDEEAIETELRSLTPEDFARERLGIVDLEGLSLERIVPHEAWARCLNPNAARGERVTYAVDVCPDGRSAAIAVSDGSFMLVAEHHPGTVWLVDKLARLLEARPGRVLVDPRGPAGALLVDLAEAGIPVVQVTAGEHAQACGGLLAAVTAEVPLVSHAGQPVLDAAVAGATRRPYGDAWAWSRRTSAVDISPLVAVTLARWGAQTVAPAAGFVNLDDYDEVE